VFTIKQVEQSGLFAALDALPCSHPPDRPRDVDTNHGRDITRTIQLLPALVDLPLPHVDQM
jgi:hypothetical protein